MAAWILTSVENFYMKSKKIISSRNSTFYLEFYSMEAKQSKLLKIGEQNKAQVSDMVMNGLFGYSYRNFAIITDGKGVDEGQTIYSQSNIGSYIICGEGGRENLKEIECIYLRVLYKESDKSTKYLFTKIMNNLKADPHFKQGFDSSSIMGKRALYDINIISKIKKFDFKNELALISLKMI